MYIYMCTHKPLQCVALPFTIAWSFCGVVSLIRATNYVFATPFDFVSKSQLSVKFLFAILCFDLFWQLQYYDY